MQGGGYKSYLEATTHLRKDPAIFYFAGNLTSSPEEYEAQQEAYMKTESQYEVDEETYSILRVRNFDKMLNGLNIDVLALFGEKDTNVDWRKTQELYKSTIGLNPNATLTIHTFPKGNHSINVTQTGSVREVEETPIGSGNKCEGYYQTQMAWLRKHVLSEE